MQVLGGLGVSANLLVVGVLAVTGAITRDTHTGLLVHQAAVDCARAAILFPLGRSQAVKHLVHVWLWAGWSLLTCQQVSPKCSLLETAFLCLATVSTIGLLTTVLNSTPVQASPDIVDIPRYLDIVDIVDIVDNCSHLAG